jgi:hypothetical protein
MTHEEIEITILSDGRIEYTIKGVKGSACESLSAVLEKLGRVEEATRTSEYYDQDPDLTINLSHDA